MLIIVDAIISYFPKLRRHPLALNLRGLTDITLKPVRKILPPELPIDVSPLIVILLLNFFMLLW